MVSIGSMRYNLAIPIANVWDKFNLSGNLIAIGFFNNNSNYRGEF